MVSPTPKWLDPVRSVDTDLLNRLELVSTKVAPLPGGTGRRLNGVDPRFSKLQGEKGDEICFFEHIATVRDTKTDQFYVAFRETPDALYERSKDPEKFPEWLMKTREKLNECLIFIYQVYRHPKEVPILRSQEDWLMQIADPKVFDSLALFLSKNNVISAEQYRRFQ